MREFLLSGRWVPMKDGDPDYEAYWDQLDPSMKRETPTEPKKED